MTIPLTSSQRGTETEQAPDQKRRFEPSGKDQATGAGRRVSIKGLSAWYGDQYAVKELDLEFEPNKVTAIIGPSGCGKSTMVRCINRMHEEIPGTRVEGEVLLDDQDLYANEVDVTSVRRAVGMVFQKPNPFPTMSVYDNVASGPKLSGTKGKHLKERVEQSLRSAALWDEVKDRLDRPGIGLSGGQQQRLCIARTLAVEPEVVLMDEPCSALDPVATLRIEELIEELKTRYTIVIVTHNMQQAGRVADSTAFMLTGELVEVGPTETIFTKPTDDRTEQYVSGRFG
ncbi:MAG TPA: phosphate ABC transporter ATP-binding protein PstB [Thermoleophilaceae bacterium]|jgi:phosphate transport system ATP-binding protein